MLAWHGCDNLPLNGFMELAIVDPEPALFGGIEDICVALPKTNIGVIVCLSGMNGLRRNNIISGHYHHERNLVYRKVVRIEPVKQALLITQMLEGRAQRE